MARKTPLSDLVLKVEGMAHQRSPSTDDPDLAGLRHLAIVLRLLQKTVDDAVFRGRHHSFEAMHKIAKALDEGDE